MFALLALRARGNPFPSVARMGWAGEAIPAATLQGGGIVLAVLIANALLARPDAVGRKLRRCCREVR